MKFRCSALTLVLLATTAIPAITVAISVAQQQGGPGQGRPRGRGMGGPGMGMGRGIAGTVTAVSSDTLTVKTESGETYTVHFSANTRFMKEAPRPAGDSQQAGDNQPGAAATRGGSNGGRDGFGEGGRLRQGRIGTPAPIQSSDIKPGDAVMASGEIDASAKSVGAVFVMQVDPERAKQMREMQANFGKTWLMGRVKAINEAQITIESNVDNATHTFAADENTTLRKRRDPITLADIQPGDMLRAEGSLKAGVFVATTINVMGNGPGGGPRPQE